MDVQYFREQMLPQNFLSVFYDKDKKEFYEVKEETLLTRKVIEDIRAGHCVLHSNNNNRNFAYNIIKIYSIHSKWVVFYNKNFFSNVSPKTSESGIIVFSDIDSDFEKEISSSGIILEDNVYCYSA